MPNLYRIQNDQLRLAFHPGQLRAWDSRRRFVFVLAGTQAGKTSFGPWWLKREIYGAEGYEGRGPGDYIAATASYDLFKLKMLPEIRNVFEHLLRCGRYWSGDKILELADPATGKFQAKRADDPMWGRIILRSAAAPGGLESATAKAAWLDECGQDDFPLEAWEAVLRRLSLHQGRVLGTTTLYNLGWLKSEIYDPWTNGDKDIDVIQFASTLNPLFPAAEMERAARTMQDWRYQMFYLGQFARPAGLIYNCFQDKMLVDAFPVPVDWPVTVGVDFGGANTATAWLAQDPATGIWYAYKESLEGGMTSAAHAEKATAEAGAREVQAIGGAPGETQQRMDWNAGGFHVNEPPIADVESGIDRVTALIQEDRLRVFRDLRGLRDELGTYRRKLDAAGNPTDEIADKRKFHRLDALRYAATGIQEAIGVEDLFGWG